MKKEPKDFKSIISDHNNSNVRFNPKLAWTLEQLTKLKVGEIGESPSFLFLWAGS